MLSMLCVREALQINTAANRHTPSECVAIRPTSALCFGSRFECMYILAFVTSDPLCLHGDYEIDLPLKRDEL